MTSSPAGRRGFDPGMSGIAADRYILTDCVLRCGDALHDDAKYGAEVMRFRRVATPHINRHWKRWVQLRDGYTDPDMGQVVGFWVDDSGKQLSSGMKIPKDAYIGMEGALMEILHADGIYWVKERVKSKTKAGYEKVLKARGVDEPAKPEDDDDEDDDED